MQRVVLWILVIVGSLVGLRGALDTVVSLVMGDGPTTLLRDLFLASGLCVAGLAATRLRIAPWSVPDRLGADLEATPHRVV